MIDSKNLMLVPNAETTHDSAEDMYGAYGAYVSTESCGDICVQVVEWDWLEEKKSKKEIRKAYPKMSAEEVDELSALAYRVRRDMIEVESLLEAAVEAYLAGDLAATVEAVSAAKDCEQDHGDCPSAQSLERKILSEKSE